MHSDTTIWDLTDHLLTLLPGDLTRENLEQATALTTTPTGSVRYESDPGAATTLRDGVTIDDIIYIDPSWYHVGVQPTPCVNLTQAQQHYPDLEGVGHSTIENPVQSTTYAHPGNGGCLYLAFTDDQHCLIDVNIDNKPKHA